MNEVQAMDLANRALAEAEAEAPPLKSVGFPASYASILHEEIARQAFIIGYLTESIKSLLLEHCNPRLVSMDDRCDEAIDLSIPVVVSGEYQRAERQTNYYPGSPECFAIDNIFIGGFRLPTEIAAWIEREYGDEIQDAILERRASLEHERGVV